MGIFSDLGNAFSGEARKRYDYTHSLAFKTLESNGYLSLVYGGGILSGEQKALFFVFMTGYFDVITYQYQSAYMNNNNLEDAYSKAIGLVKLFFTDKLGWTQNYLRNVLSDVSTLNYQRPEIVRSITDFGTAVGLNLHTDASVAKILGHDDISVDNGKALLKEFFDDLK